MVHLANEGFLLRSGEQAALIDAFVAQPYSIYPSVPEPVRRSMLEREPPFQAVRVALVSHVHADHFQPRAARAFLASHPETRLVSSPDVIDALEPGAELRERIRTVLPADGESERLDFEGLEVEFLRLRHGGRRWAELHNLGHVIRIGGRTVLHVGDAATDPSVYAPYRLAERGLDVALVPYWLFLEGEAGRKLVDEHLVARLRIAVHVPRDEADAIEARLAESHPDVRVAREPLQTFVVD